MSNSADPYGTVQRVRENNAEHTKTLAQVLEQMESWFPEHLPILYSNQDISNSVFSGQVQAFRNFLRGQYNDLHRLRLAYYHLARKIAQGNEDGDWALDIPSPIVSVPRTRSSRSHQFFKAGIESGKLHQRWLEIIANSPTSPQDRSNLLADVLISAAYYGGLANPRALISLANALKQDIKPLQRIDQTVWIDLMWSDGSDLLNYKMQLEGETSWCTLYRFYPDNRTLGLILSLHKYNKRHEEEEEEEEDNTSTLNQSDAWSLIKARLLSKTYKTGINSLRAFCSGAQSVTEMLQGIDIPQALLETASGRVATTSLLPQQLQGWLLQAQPAEETQTFDFQTVATSLLAATQAKPKVEKHDIVQQDSLKTVDSLHKKATSALDLQRGGLKRSAAEGVKELNELISISTPLHAKILIQWSISKLATLQLSSVQRYYHEVAQEWLYQTNEQELDELDESELEHIYGQILAKKTNAKSRSYLHGRLKNLHRFASEQYGLPALTSFFSGAGDSENQVQVQVRVGYIPEIIYKSMLKSMDNLVGLEPETVEGLKVLLTLAYRTGMRRGELLKLRLSDIEESIESWIFIVNNRYGNNKTDSARRKIPTYLLLLPDELRQFQEYIGRRRSQNPHTTNTLVFSEPHAVTVPHSGTMVSNLIKYLLARYGLGDLTFHHLRHSALTNLMVVLHGNKRLISRLTGYTPEHADKIRAELYCANINSRRDIYSAISGLAGHLTPDTTFLHYIHETSLLLWERLVRYDPMLDIRNARYFSGLSTEFINKHLDQKPRALKLSELRSEILARLVPATHIIKAEPEPKHLPVEESTENNKPDPPTVTECYSALKDIEGGDSIAAIAIRYTLKEQVVMRWFEAAKRLQELRTSRGNRRLFPSNLKETVIGIPLLPSKPQDKTTQAEIDSTINQLRQYFREDRAESIWCITYWIFNSSHSKAGIRFTDPQDLNRFIKALQSIFPYKRWHLKLLITPKSTQADIQVWRVKGMVNPAEEFVQAGKHIQAYLTLRHKDEEEILASRKKNMNQYASSLLRYVFHMLAIMIGDSPKKEHNSTINNEAVNTEVPAAEETKTPVVEATQADTLHKNSAALDTIAQPSSLSELNLERHEEQKQSAEASADDMLKAYFGDEYFELFQ